MKNLSSIFAAGICLWALIFHSTSSSAQAIASQKSAKAAAASDAQLITANIENSEDVMFLSQKAITNGTDEKLKELAQQMSTDHTTMLYAIQQLASAGTGSSNQSAGKTDGIHKQAAEINEKLSRLSGPDFDTAWVSSLLSMQQAKYDELSQAKEAITNIQLKMAVTEAIPVIRKHLSQLRMLQKSLLRIAIQKKKEAARKEKK